MNKDYAAYNAKKTSENGEKHGMPKQQRRILKWILIFFGLMILFTLLSRAADSITVPKVTVGSPVSNTLDFQVSASGTVEAKGEINVNMDEGYTVKEVLVSEGQEVKTGDLLLRLDEEQMQKQLNDAEKALSEAQIDARISALNAETASEGSAYEEQQKLYQRSLTDGELSVLAEDRKIADAQDALEQARMELGLAEAKYHESQSKTYDERLKEAEETLKKAAKAKEDADITHADSLRSANRNLSDARIAYDEALTSSAATPSTNDNLNELQELSEGEESGSNGGTYDPYAAAEALRKAQNAWARAQEDYNSALFKADRSKQNANDDFAEAQKKYNELRDGSAVEETEAVQTADTALQTARKTLEEKQKALKDAEDAKNQKLMELDRTQQDKLEDIEDAKEKDKVTSHNESIERQRDSLTAQKADLAMQKLVEAVEDARKTIAEGGELLAPADGVITKLNIAAGGKTTGESVMKMTDSSAGYRFKVVMPTEDAKYVERGDKATIIPAGKQTGVDGAVVESMRALTGENSGKTEIIASLPKDFTEAGLTATFKVDKRSSKYQVTVPTSAVSPDSNGRDYYVLVLREKETVLGVEWFAEKRTITILERDSKTVAVQPGTLDSRDQIILTTSKPIQDGDRVRVEIN